MPSPLRRGHKKKTNIRLRYVDELNEVLTSEVDVILVDYVDGDAHSLVLGQTQTTARHLATAPNRCSKH